jgi:hypothetical protein
MLWIAWGAKVKTITKNEIRNFKFIFIRILSGVKDIVDVFLYQELGNYLHHEKQLGMGNGKGYDWGCQNILVQKS